MIHNGFDLPIFTVDLDTGTVMNLPRVDVIEYLTEEEYTTVRDQLSLQLNSTINVKEVQNIIAEMSGL